ncbi:MAG TPA: AMIN domain-containing protein, partial [Candidatus Dormibacteraeota bacterium]|nr:AMIN domain-containing protein [Candidatus Dormibacteraeota bacterium]
MTQLNISERAWSMRARRLLGMVCLLPIRRRHSAFAALNAASVLITLFITVPLFAASAQTPVSAGMQGAAAVISNVAITQAAERTAVRVEGEGRLEVRASQMQNPDRLVLDFAGARLAAPKTTIAGKAGPVRGVRLGQYRPDVARVVVDLTEATPYQLEREGTAVVVYFGTQPRKPVASVVASPALAEAPASVGRNAAAAVISNVAITQAAERTAVRVEGEGHLEVRTTQMRNPDRLVLD